MRQRNGFGDDGFIVQLFERHEGQNTRLNVFTDTNNNRIKSYNTRFLKGFDVGAV